MNGKNNDNYYASPKKSAAYRCGYFLYLVALLIYPYIFIIHYFFPASYSFGVEKSLAVALVTLALLLAFLLQMKKIISQLGKGDLILYLFIFLSLLAIRLIIYQESTTILLQYRVFIIPIIYAGLASYYLAAHERKILMQKVIIWQTIIQALFGIFLLHFVYTGRITWNIMNLWTGGGRMVGTLMSSNLFPGFLILGAFVIASPYLKARIPQGVRFVLLLTLTTAIIYSNSRLPSIVAIIILFLTFMNILMAKKVFFSKIITIAILVAFLLNSLWILSGAFEQTIGRTFNDGPNLRLIKYQLGMNNVLDKALLGMFIGSTREKMHSRVMMESGSDEGLKFSDNSFILMMELLGVLMTLLYILLFTIIIRKSGAIRGNYILIFYFIASLFFNSAIGWDIWLVYFFATYYCLQPTMSETSNKLSRASA
ncbi:MAG: hypothetical protein V1928_04115 [Parcubacteria group bacterium]